MLDPKFIRAHPEEVIQNMVNKGYEPGRACQMIGRWLWLDKLLRKQIQREERLKYLNRQINREVQKLVKAGVVKIVDGVVLPVEEEREKVQEVAEEKIGIFWWIVGIIAFLLCGIGIAFIEAFFWYKLKTKDDEIIREIGLCSFLCLANAMFYGFFDVLGLDHFWFGMCLVFISVALVSAVCCMIIDWRACKKIEEEAKREHGL